MSFNRWGPRIMSSNDGDPTFWLLSYTGKEFRSIEEPELHVRDVVEELKGSVVNPDWSPPKFRVIGRGPWPDWMHYPIPFISDRTLECLEDLIKPCCQILPAFQTAGHRYSLLNVTARVPRDRWSCEESSVYGEVIANAEGISVAQDPRLDMFRLEGLSGRTFVSDALAKRSFQARLSGALFIDPSIRSMHLPFIQTAPNSSGTAFIRRGDDISS